MGVLLTAFEGCLVLSQPLQSHPLQLIENQLRFDLDSFQIEWSRLRRWRRTSPVLFAWSVEVFHYALKEQHQR